MVIGESSSIFHDMVITAVTEGRLGPDHPGSLGMKKGADYKKGHNTQGVKRFGSSLRSEYLEVNNKNSIKDRGERSKKDFSKGRYERGKLYNDDTFRRYKNKLDNKSKTTIPGSNKDEKLNREYNNLMRRENMSNHDLDKYARHSEKIKKKSTNESSILNINLI